MKTRILSILALLLMAVSGAWAQTERLLTTITPTGQTTYNETTPGAVTVTQDCQSYSGHGWVFDTKTGSVTVEANEGYTISKCVFTLSNGSTSTTRTISTSPFKINFVWDTYSHTYCYCEGTDQDYVYHGVKSIQVYTNTVDVTANDGGDGNYWSTYYNATQAFTADANTTVYQAAVNSGKTAVVLTEVTGREIPAGKGVVLKSSAATITLTPTTTTTQTLEGNELTGVDVATTAPSNAYCLSKETTGSARGVGFYTYTGTIPAHRAYLVVAGGPSHARGFLGFGDDDNTTGISLPEAVVIENDGPIYDLSGRRIIGQPQKGIYVKNRKKVVIK